MYYSIYQLNCLIDWACIAFNKKNMLMNFEVIKKIIYFA